MSRPSLLRQLRVVRSREPVSVLRALRLDEALLRAAEGAWLVLHDGVDGEAVVVGLSGKPEELVHVEEASSAGVPLIRRFSGGGTVLLGPNCVWATLVGGEEHLPSDVAGRGPRPLMEWTERVWSPVFGRIGEFRLREHDYAFGDLKFGGNAQALSKKRWLHHTSLLWSLDDARTTATATGDGGGRRAGGDGGTETSAERMRRLLKHPARAPEYRAGRDHGSFLTSIERQNDLARRRSSEAKRGGGGESSSLFFESREHFVDALPHAVASAGGFEIVPTTLEEAEEAVAGIQHHRSTVVLE